MSAPRVCPQCGDMTLVDSIRAGEHTTSWLYCPSCGWEHTTTRQPAMSIRDAVREVLRRGLERAS